MPELPEVETIRQQLAKKIKNKKIEKVEIRDSRMINIPPEEFKKIVQGTKIKDVRRRAKILIIDLDNEYSIITHLKLTGNLLYNQEVDDKTDVCFIFKGGDKLVYKDVRKLGYMKLFPTSLAEDTIKAHNFGPEVLEKDFTLEKFRKLLASKGKRKIKPLLMDQKFIAGIGNIYSQEACFRAKINPQRLVSSLSEKEIKLLYEKLREILVIALKKHGTSVDNYLDIYGQEGQFAPLLKVYGKKGKPCPRCGTKIKVVKIAGRSTYFCPRCQK